MESNSGLSIFFRLNKQRTKEGKPTVYVRITLDDKRSEMTTNVVLVGRQWDDKHQCMTGMSEEAQKINASLQAIRTRIQKIYAKMVALEKDITPELIKNEYLGIKEKKMMLNELMDFYYIRFSEKVNCGKKAKGTLKGIYTTRLKLHEFVKWQYKISDFSLADLKLSFVSNFEHFLMTKHKLSNNSAMKYIRILKRIIKFGHDQDWIKTNPLSVYRCSYNEPERDRLTAEEVMKLYAKKFNNERLSNVRDIFVFCCFTGLSYLDVYRLSPEHIVSGIDGLKWIVKSREKTGTVGRVPLLQIPMDIIEKYRDDYYCRSKGKLLPVNSNQRYNGYLKELADICEINKHLTTHVARHTFATAITLENDVPIETVSQMLGHKSIKTTQIYAKVTQRKMSNNMQALEKKLNLQLIHQHDLKKLSGSVNES